MQEAFLPILLKKAATLSPGDTLRAETKFGDVVSQGHKQRVLNYIDSGEREGARKVYQSNASAPFKSGFYVPPVIFDQVSSGQQIAREEIFGPVLSVIAFRDEEDAIKTANSTIYGLSAILC